MKVLIVEDFRDLVDILKLQFARMGNADVKAVEDGLQACFFLEEQGELISLIVACGEQSRNMRLTLGEGTLEMARKKNPNVKIILVTTNPRLGHLDYLRSIGADYVLVKPFMYRDLINAINIVRPEAPLLH